MGSPLGNGTEIRDQFGERPGVNRPVERHTGRLTPNHVRHDICAGGNSYTI